MMILDNRQIQQKITRLAYEIIEHNTDVDRVILAGINNNGYRLASLLRDEIDHILGKQTATILAQIKLDPAAPHKSEITIDQTKSDLRNKSVIIIDDVANTGRTIFYTFQLFLDIALKRLSVAVMVDRKHKSFPVHVDYVGLSLATTSKENIDVNFKKKGKFDAVLS